MKFVGDIILLTWNQTDDFVSNFEFPLEIGFRDNDGFPVNFNNLSFGYELKKGSSVISSYSFIPTTDFQYVSSDQDYLYATVIENLSPDIAYKLKIWATNNDQNFESIYDLVLPLPPSPYPSWHWDAKTNSWQPPVPMPSDPPPGKWIWDEETQQWVEKQI